QLFERRLAGLDEGDRAELLAGPAATAWQLLFGQPDEAYAEDPSFAVLHGLYWLSVNLAATRPLLIAVDDAHWGDVPSLRWLAELEGRGEGLTLALVVALRPAERASGQTPLVTLRGQATAVLRPRLLSQAAVTAIVREKAGGEVSEELCAAVNRASGGNPFF